MIGIQTGDTKVSKDVFDKIQRRMLFLTIFLQTTIWDFVDKKNSSEGQEWSRGQVKIPKASMFKVS